MTLLMTFLNKYLSTKNELVGAALGEFCGTFMMLVFGLGVIVQTETTGAAFISISLGWGFAVMMGVFWAGKLGSGHINPAVTLAFACVGKLQWKRVPIYWVAQVLGAYFGALVIFLMYNEKIRDIAVARDGGKYNVETTGNYFVTLPKISLAGAFFDQFFGTFLLSSCALVIVDDNGFNLPDYLHPFFLGLMVATIVGCFAINAGAALNPARDLGPRIMIAMTGWGKAAFTAKQYYFWVPIVAPILGAIVGAIFYYVFIGIHLHSRNTKVEDMNSKPEGQNEEEAMKLSVVSNDNVIPAN